MYRLPIEIHIYILELLDTNDLLNFRLINKYFNSVIQNHVRIKNLVIPKNRSDLTEQISTNSHVEIMNQSYSINGINSNLFKNEFMMIILSKLKRIVVGCFSDFSFNWIGFLNQFNQFNQLKELYLIGLELKKNSILRLSNLKLISTDNCIISSNFKLKLNCPNLESFYNECYYDFPNFELIYPLSIKIIQTNSFTKELNQFENIKKLMLFDLNLELFNHLDITSSFQNLKSIHFHNLDKDELNKLRNLINKKTIDLYLFGIKIENGIDYDFLFNQNGQLLVFCFEDNEHYKYQFLKDNYYKITEKIIWDFDLEYDKLIKYFNSIPDDLINKLDCKFICALYLDGDLNQLDFNKFIKYLKKSNNSILNFHIGNCSFNQEFYDNLYLYTYYLKSLKIWSLEEPIENFEFLFKLQYLKFIIIGQEASLEFIIKLFKNLKYLTHFDFENFNLEYNYSKDVYELRIKNIHESFNKKVDLIDYLEKLI